MKFLILLILFPAICLAQSSLDTLTLLSGKVKLLTPKDLKVMTEQMWTAKYRQTPRPMMVLTDENGEVNLLASMTKQPLIESQIASFKDFEVRQVKNGLSYLTLLDQGIKNVNGKKTGFIKFLSQATDQKVFNYYFFTVAEEKVLFFTFNCIERLQKQWEPVADKIIASLQVK